MWESTLTIITVISIAGGTGWTLGYWAGNVTSPRISARIVLKKKAELKAVKQELEGKKRDLKDLRTQYRDTEQTLKIQLEIKDMVTKDLYARLQRERDELERAFRYRWAADEIKHNVLLNAGTKKEFEKTYCSGKSLEEMIP